VRFSTSNNGSSKTPQNMYFGESPCQKTFAKKVEKNIFFPAFLAVSLHEELKKHHKKSQTKKTQT
jgi:hypothetical protein